MTDIVAQASFNSGEWSPKLNARVDLAKYRSGAALLENFFVDYRGGASTRPGSKYVIQAYKSSTPVRVITFQAAFNVGYVIEIGNGYFRFMFAGAPVVESPIAITTATQANPCVVTAPGHTYVIGDWIYITGIVGMTELNGRFFSISNVSGNNLYLADLNGVAINSTGYTTYTSGGTTARVYTLASPYTSADDLRLIKFVQSINQMILCHPNHPPYVLTLLSATNWTLVPITIGATIQAPTGVTVSTSLGAGAVNYAYGVTSIDSTGQESGMSSVGTLASKLDIRTAPGSNQISWTGAPGAVAYNIYEATVSYFGAIPAGVQYGFIGTTKSTTFIDSNIGADFSQTPPVPQNPFVGAGINSTHVTVAGTYTTVPTVTTTGGSPSVTAVLTAVLSGVSFGSTAAGLNYVIGEIVTFSNGVSVQVTSVGIGGFVFTLNILNPGNISSGTTPANPLSQVSTTGIGSGFHLTVTWGVSRVDIVQPGAGYSSVPTLVFSAGAGAATATLAPAIQSFPTVPGFIQQRLVLAAPTPAPQTFNMSRPGQTFNFDISSPVRSDDAITGTLVSVSLNSIKSVIGSFAGMLILTDKGPWLVNGGSSGSAITPTTIVANPQSFIGANDVPPIVANYDVLYVQSKGSAIRDLAFNIYFSTFTGTDISTLSSHLFFGHEILEWTWAEQPFYVAQAVRNDGVMLSLTYLKEQEFVGWTHYITAGAYSSVTSCTEATSTAGTVDAVYTVVNRTVNSNAVKYIERFVERAYPNGVADAWCVDAGLQYSGAPKSTFTGAEHLAGLTVTGVADGAIIPAFVMPVSGQFTLAAAASKVTVGLGYVCKLQTLAIDTGEPSIQAKVKKINSVTVRVSEALGLSIGTNFNNQIPMKDLVIGNVSSTLTGLESQIVTNLMTGDAETNIDPSYNIYGQYCITQSFPWPASILGVFPAITVGEPR